MMSIIFLWLLIISVQVSTLNAITISESGVYVLGQNVQESVTGITISANNVTLDLNDKIVTGNTTGIVVTAGYSNIVIKNGTVSASETGISIGSLCNNVVVSKMLIIGCETRGIVVNPTAATAPEQITFEQVVIENCSTGASADFPLYINRCNDITIKNCILRSNGTASREIRVIELVTCVRGLIENVVIMNNVAGTRFEGIRFSTSCSNFIVSKVFVLANSATGTLAAMQWGNGANNAGHYLVDCIIANNSAGSGNFFGYNILPTTTRCLFERCFVLNNTVNTASANGFNLDQPSFCDLFNCRAMFMRNLSNTGANGAAGFNISTSSGGSTGVKNCRFINNIAFANVAPADTRSYGFRVVASVAGGNANNVYFNNIGANNGVTTPVAGYQVTSTSGTGSNVSGVPATSITDFTLSSLSGAEQYGCIRVV